MFSKDFHNFTIYNYLAESINEKRITFIKKKRTSLTEEKSIYLQRADSINH